MMLRINNHQITLLFFSILLISSQSFFEKGLAHQIYQEKNYLKKIDSNRVILAIDCGSSSEYRSTQGFKYMPDIEYSENSKVADYKFNEDIRLMNIRYTNDQNIYLTERHADWTFFYEIPINHPGKYVIILKFAEMYFDEPNKRVFNILFGDTRVSEGIDIFARVGKYAAYDEYIEFELKEDIIYFKGKPCANAYKFIEKRLILGFEKTNKDNPKIDGIVVIEGTLEDTDYYEIQEFRKMWDKSIEEEKKRTEFERKKQESKNKKDKTSDIDIQLIEEPSDEESRSLVNLLLSGPGLIIIIVIIIFILGVINIGGDDNKRVKKKVKEEKTK